MKTLKTMLIIFVVTLGFSSTVAYAGKHMTKVGHFENITMGWGGSHQDTKYYLENEWGYVWIYDSSADSDLQVRFNEYFDGSTVSTTSGYKNWKKGADQVEITNAWSPANLQVLVGGDYGLEFRTNTLDFNGVTIYYGDWWLDTRD